MAKLSNRWQFKDRQMQDFVVAVLSLLNGRLDINNAPTLTQGNGTTGNLTKWTDTDEIGDATNTDTDVASAVSLKHTQGTDQGLDTGGANAATAANVKSAVDLKHTRSHSIIGTSDHTSAATVAYLLKADANGLPVTATNTDAEVAAIVASGGGHSAISGLFDVDGNGDSQPVSTMELDCNFELDDDDNIIPVEHFDIDGNYDIMPLST